VRRSRPIRGHASKIRPPGSGCQHCRADCQVQLTEQVIESRRGSRKR
jgi:hypothetical protein